jgi:hypothetical protein
MGGLGERLARRLTLTWSVQWQVLCYQIESGWFRKSCKRGTES